MERDADEFVAARLPALTGYARALTAASGDGHDAEGLAQEALARTGAVWWRVRHDDPEGHARRTALRLGLRRWGRLHPSRRASRTPAGTTGDRRAAAACPAPAVDRLLRSLPPRTRAVLVLRYVDGLTDEVAADLLGLSVGAVRRRAARALAAAAPPVLPAPGRWSVDAAEDLVARRLRSWDADHDVDPGMLERTLDAARRRRRRPVGAIASGLAAVSLVLGVATLAGGRSGPSPPDPPAPDLREVALDGELAELLGSTAVLVPREGGWFDLRATSLTADGTLSGADQHLDPQWFDTWGSARSVDLGTGEQHSYDEAATILLGPVDTSSRLTLEHLDPRHRLDLVCTPRVGGRRSQLSDASVAEASVRLDAGHVVWSTSPDGGQAPRVWTADGCGGAPVQLGTPGLVRAVAWPDLYLSTPDDPWLVRVDAETGEVVDLPRPEVADADLPGAGARDDTAVAASQEVLAWAAGRSLLVLDLRSGRTDVVATDLPLVTGSNGTEVLVGAGDRLVSWSSSPVDGDPARSRGLLHDPATGASVTLDGEIRTDGPWVVWLADDGYRVVRTG